MSEAEGVVESTFQPPAKKPKRKYVRRARAAVAKPKAVAAPKDSPYAGMTETECPTACTLERCVITHMNICAHPLKGGLQPMLQVGPDGEGRLRRESEAKRILAGRKLDVAGQ